MNTYPKIFLKSGKERSLQRFHPWVFSGAIRNSEGKPKEGDIVEVYSSAGDYLATGHYQNNSITVRLFSFHKKEIDRNFWKEKFQAAYQHRCALGFINNEKTNTYRLIHGEGDGFSGLVVDIYNTVAVFQAHSLGMYLHRQVFAEILKEIYGEKLLAVYDKSEGTLPFKAPVEKKNSFLIGEVSNIEVLENGNKYKIDVVEGQKTGFFIDQRDNRKLLEQYTNGKNVLNTFCYTGGFSVAALHGGASLVHSVDSSKSAIELTNKNIELNFGTNVPHESFAIDVFDFLKNIKNKYDVIVLDPPAFAKHRDALEQGLKGYRSINQRAFEQIRSGGILFTFSCSQVVSKEDFRTAVFSAATIARRNVKILHQLTQPSDHPVSIFHPEGEYLKGLVLYVE